MLKTLKALGRASLNLIYPVTCSICEARLAANNGLCGDCVRGIYKNEFGIAACRYEGVLKESIRLFKYSGMVSLLKVFSPLLLEFIEKSIDMDKIDLVIPVPLHSSKLRERGFNQAYLLSLPIAKRYGKPLCSDNLIKKVVTKPQTDFDRAGRLKNLKGSFSVKDPSSLKGKKVLLVDDVFTTGATIESASHALKKAGVKKIKAVALAGGADL